jgi:hypothetical protein
MVTHVATGDSSRVVAAYAFLIIAYCVLYMGLNILIFVCIYFSDAFKVYRERYQRWRKWQRLRRNAYDEESTNPEKLLLYEVVQRLSGGPTGTIVHIYGNDVACLVEFIDDKGHSSVEDEEFRNLKRVCT